MNYKLETANFSFDDATCAMWVLSSHVLYNESSWDVGAVDRVGVRCIIELGC
jgi:membrane-bound lytic murein transglycosylase MltF